jgi:hypothetical protein
MSEPSPNVSTLSSLEQMQSQLDEASSMVLLAMNASSDLGLVIQFLKRAFAAKDINQLAHDLLEHLASLGLNSSVLITADDGQ